MRKEREPFFINYEIITRSSGAKRDPQKREREREREAREKKTVTRWKPKFCKFLYVVSFFFFSGTDSSSSFISRALSFVCVHRYKHTHTYGVV